MTEYSVYGLIPARGESSGLPNKNIKLLYGRPLITYIIEAALSASALDKVYVSTDSEKIAEVARKYGTEVIIHPVELSTPTASTFGVIQNAIRVFQKKELRSPDIVVTMRPTSPLCLSTDINQAVQLLSERPEVDSVISVVKSDVHPYRVLKINREGELEHSDEQSTEKNFPQRRQSFDDVYIRNGAIYATRTHIINSGSLWGKHSLPFVMPKERSVNINDAIDFLLAESIMITTQIKSQPL